MILIIDDDVAVTGDKIASLLKAANSTMCPLAAAPPVPGGERPVRADNAA